MKKFLFLVFICAICMDPGAHGQVKPVQDTVYGNLVINSDPVEVQVDIPGLGVSYPKKDNALIVEFIHPADYLVRVSSGNRVVEHKVSIRSGIESHFFFNVRKRKVKLTEEFRIVSRSARELSEDQNDVFTVVEEPPLFPGGEEAKNRYLRENLRYPDSAVNEGIQGNVFVHFIVEKDGRLSDVSVLRGVAPMCNREAVRVVSAMPAWSPGRQRGKPVRVQVILPVRFSLEKRK